MSKWDELSMAEKAEMMKVAVRQGITNLSDIKQRYNEFAEGENIYSGDEKETQQMEVSRSPHIDLALSNPWLYQKLHPAPKKKEVYEPSTFAGRVAQLAGVGELEQKYTDYVSSTIQQVPIVGTAISAADLGYDLNRLYHNPSLTATKDVTLDAASLVPALRKTMKGWWMKGNSGSFITETGQIINNPRVASTLEVVLQPFRTAINTGVYGARALDFLDDSKAFLKEMYNSSKIGKHFPIKALGGPLVEAAMNEYKSGGDIHIKPSHRGRLTELKKRTGKTEAELYKTGGPAVRKMITFARNSRKWKHGLGGNLFDGTSQDSQKMQIGLDVQGWPNYTTEQIIAYGDENERRRKAIQDAYLNFVTESNDATAVANGRPQNKHLEERGIKGAKAHRAWEEEHPIATFAGNVLGAAPLTIAAIPAAGAAIKSAPAVASALTPGSSFWMNPITQQVAASTLGGTAVDAASETLTNKSWGENVRKAVQQTTGWNPGNSQWTNVLFDMTNPGYFTPYGAIYSGTGKAIEAVSPVNRAVKNTVDNIERRGAETFMRTTPFANPLPESENNIVSMWNGENGGRQRLAHIANYIITGKRVGPKGYYNSFASYVPLDNSTLISNPSLTQRWKDFMNPKGESFGYSGFVDVNGQVPKMTDRKDMIDAFLYGEEIDPSFGMKRLAIGEDFGPHADYIRTKYPSKAHDIQVYEMNTPEGFSEATPVGDWKGVDKGLFEGGTEDYLNVAGHIGTKGVTSDGTSVIQRQDIWKFNPDEYFNRWLQNKRPYTEMSPRKQKLIKWGLKEVDRLGTPVISRTKWDRWG